MMTIEEYRATQAPDYPRNGEGMLCPQLIDDIYEAREALRHLMRCTHGLHLQIAAEGLGHLNRAIRQLGIIELKPIRK